MSEILFTFDMSDSTRVGVVTSEEGTLTQVAEPSTGHGGRPVPCKVLPRHREMVVLGVMFWYNTQSAADHQRVTIGRGENGHGSVPLLYKQNKINK